MVTIIDKASRQIGIIDSIFRSQFAEYDSSKTDHPIILDAAGRDGIHGRYIHSMDFCSSNELFNVQELKQHISDRFEQANRLELLTSQLIEIRDNATRNVNYYNDNLSENAMVVIEFMNKINRLRNIHDPEYFTAMMEHSAVIFIHENYYIDQVYLGADRIHCKARKKGNGQLWSIGNNQMLYLVCLEVVDFINAILQPRDEKKYPDKWYALLHAVYIALGIEKQFIDKGRQAIESYGKNKYGTGQGFYRAWMDIDLNNMVTYVKSLPEKDRNHWKRIISEISGQNSEVLSWLKNQPH